MVRLSKYQLSEDKLEKLFDLFFNIVGKRNNKTEFLDILNDVLSQSEKIMIAKRIALSFLLMKVIENGTICYVLKLSPSTVAKFAFILQTHTDRGIQKAFQLIILKENLKDMFMDICNTLFAPGIYGVNWSAAWQRKLEAERKKIHGL